MSAPLNEEAVKRDEPFQRDAATVEPVWTVLLHYSLNNNTYRISSSAYKKSSNRRARNTQKLFQQQGDKWLERHTSRH
jgi:hypothetical protein